MTNATMWSDTANGNIGFGIIGESHGEALETFFILPVDDIPVLMRDGSVTERENMFSDAKWKPKVLSWDISNIGRTFTITDPGHLIETVNPDTGKVRKRNVVADLTGGISPNYVDFFYKACECAFFSISLLPLKTSKDIKRYDALMKEWDEIATWFGFGLRDLKLRANSVHYGLRSAA